LVQVVYVGQEPTLNGDHGTSKGGSSNNVRGVKVWAERSREKSDAVKMRKASGMGVAVLIR